MRIRRSNDNVPANSRRGYIQYIQPRNMPLTTSVHYLPAHTKISAVCQDESRAYCYPLCGGDLAIHKREVNYGALPIYNGFKYLFKDGSVWQSIIKGGWVIPLDNFSLVSSVAASGIVSHPLASATKPVTTDMFSSLTDIGQTAFKQFRPKLEKVNFIESFAELPSTVASLSWRALKLKKRAMKFGDTHVAVQFGFLPLVRDVRNLYSIITDSESHINRLVRGNGKWLRRSGVVLTSSESATRQRTPSTADYAPYLGLKSTVLHTVTFQKKINFVGCFRYYVPGIDRRTFVGRASALSTLTGLRLTPSNLYDAVPWSWLVDWFTDAGEWVDQYSSTTSDDCACKYAFLTDRVEATSTLSVAVEGYVSTPNSSTGFKTQASGSSTVKVSLQLRHGAQQTFSFSGGPLNDRQALILHSIMRGR